jgi:CRISPR type III-A-associated RAMP protein Csm4
MEAVILKCRPGSRFHLGLSAMRQNETLTDTAEIIHSDVLFGAFINAVVQRFPDDIQKWKVHFENGNIRFSSAFYCVEHKGNFIYLLPKPVSLNGYNMNEHKEMEIAHKQLKKVRFISKGVWEKQLLPGDWFADKGLCFLPENRAVFLKEDFGGNTPKFKLSEKADMQKVKVRKESEDGNLYTQTDLVVMGNEEATVHWYFLWKNEGLSEEEKNNAQALITQMAEMGIGGERSTGCGHIEKVVFDSGFAIKQNVTGDLFASLSLIIPRETEKEHLLAYQVLQRGGMYYAPCKRIKMVNALAEGTVLNKQISGQIVDLSTVEKKHWRCGMSFSIPLPDAYNLKD